MRGMGELGVATMNELLKLAESYYAVASDLRHRAESTLATAVSLEKMADAICEENMRLKQPTEYVKLDSSGNPTTP